MTAPEPEDSERFVIGFHDDPDHPLGLRYWDGTTFTSYSRFSVPEPSDFLDDDE